MQLATALSGPVNHIEIVPRHVELPLPVTVQDGVVGLHSKTLYGLYVGIRDEFEQLLVEWSAEPSVELAHRLMDLTLVALLATTENLRAINTRKRIIRHYSEFSPAEELRLLNIIFCSPLQKHTKSPMLWQHRRWLLESDFDLEPALYADVASQFDPALALPSSVQLELLVVVKATDLHPRNYYAWAYARWLIARVDVDLRVLADWIYRACCSHVSDISMWSFLLHVLDLVDDKQLKGDFGHKCFLLTKLCPDHESMWWFIAGALADIPPAPWDERLREKALDFVRTKTTV